MARRAFTASLSAGTVRLSESEAHHVRDVLRLGVGDAIELFDPAGRTADATIQEISASAVTVWAGPVASPAESVRIVVYAALPKGDRADWMVEKLSEIGVATLVPLKTARGVVEPPRANKLERWKRLAIESAKQSRRRGVMTFEPALSLDEAVGQAGGGIILSSQGDAAPLSGMRVESSPVGLFIGPEGGWTEAELAAASRAGLTPARLTTTILRVETAAVVAAAIVACGAVWPDESR